MPKDLICYCFNYTESDIEADIHENRQSTIEECIKAEKKAGVCECATKNPSGKGCLGDVHRVVNRIYKNEGIIPPIKIPLMGYLQFDLRLTQRQYIATITHLPKEFPLSNRDSINVFANEVLYKNK